MRPLKDVGLATTLDSLGLLPCPSLLCSSLQIMKSKEENITHLGLPAPRPSLNNLVCYQQM